MSMLRHATHRLARQRPSPSFSFLARPLSQTSLPPRPTSTIFPANLLSPSCLSRPLHSASLPLSRAHRCLALSSISIVSHPPLARASALSGCVYSIALYSSSLSPSHRSFHTSSTRFTVHGDPTTDPAGRAGTLIARWEQWKPRIISYLWIAAIVGVGILVLRAGLWVVSFFSSLDFADVGEAAFFAGLLTGLAVVAVALLGRRALTLRPEQVYQDALKQVLNDVTVRSFLGSELHTGAFRAYSYLPGSLRLPGVTTGTTAATSIPPPALPAVPASTTSTSSASVLFARLKSYWQPRRLQLFFQVTGNTGEHGMVSAEVEKVRGTHKYNLLCVDVLNTGQRIVLQGDPSYSIYQGVIRLR